MQREARRWLDELACAAPRVDLTLLRVLADLLAAPAAPSDVLLIVGDRFAACAAEASIDGRPRDAAELFALRDVLVAEVEARRRTRGLW